MNSKSLDGKVAWVTGGSSGIGLSAAAALASAGARVAISARDQGNLQNAVDRLRLANGGIIVEPYLLDVTNAADVASTADGIQNRWGRIDILVNSAGINLARRTWEEVDFEGWERVFNINVHGAFHCIKAVLPQMRQQRDGLVINISSWAGQFTSGHAGPAYNASKSGVIAFTRALNMEEYGNGIRACAVCPGETSTPIMQRRAVPPSEEALSRMLQPEDVSAVILMVANMPPRACVNEVTISPTFNHAYR
jgi:NAD(P)-dependent dehydrogenase (short-subunit alcohol dehydrogenase family)